MGFGLTSGDMTMGDLADLFDWFALDSKHEAELTDDPKQREMWFRLSEVWAAAAQEARNAAVGGATKAGLTEDFPA